MLFINGMNNPLLIENVVGKLFRIVGAIRTETSKYQNLVSRNFESDYTYFCNKFRK